MSAVPQPRQRLPRGAAAAAIVGVIGGGVAWLGSGVWPGATTSFTRLDQLAALTLGASVGAATLGARAIWQRRRLALDAAAGAVLGGAGALAGVSLVAFAHGAIGPRLFVIERMAAWALLTAGATAAQLAWTGRRSRAAIFESLAIAGAGGATGGAIATLPGAFDVWQAAAMLWTGGVMAVAVLGPELWRAIAVVEALPRRGRSLTLFSLREFPLYDEDLRGVGEARVACKGGRVAWYPPGAGMTVDGRHVAGPRFLAGTSIVAMGPVRYRVRVLRGHP